MQKTSQNNPIFSENNSENRFQDLIAAYGRKVLYLILALIILFVVMYRMSAGSKVNALTDYMNANVEFQRFQESSLSEALSLNGSFTKLQEILKRRPELHAKYDGLIAQILIAKDDPQKGKEFADLAFKRVHNEHLPFYIDFSETTFLSANHQDSQALLRAQELKKKMLTRRENGDSSQAPQFGDTLYFFNLIRIAFLEQQLGNSKEELASWEEVLTQTTASNPNWQIVAAHFQDGSISLNDYIKEREKKLRSK